MAGSYAIEMTISEDTKWNIAQGYSDALIESYRKYYNVSPFGCGTFTTVLEFRASRLSAGQASIICDDPKVLQWLESYKEANEFENMIGEMAILGELQGQVLVVNSWDDKAKQVKSTPKALVNVAGDFQNQKDFYGYFTDGTRFFYDEKTSKEIKDFAFMNYFPIRPAIIVDGVVQTPVIAHKLLTECTAADEAKAKIKRINRLYAKPTFTVSFKTEQAKDRFNDWMTAQTQGGKASFELGQFFALDEEAEAKFVQPDNAGVESLELEFKLMVKSISSQSSVPLHKLGLPELMGQGRATAETSEDEALLERPRNCLQAGLTALLRNAILLQNQKGGGSLNPLAIKGVVLPESNPVLIEAKMARLRKDRDAKDVSLQTYLENHPDVESVQVEIDRLKEESEGLIQKLLQMRNDDE